MPKQDIEKKIEDVLDKNIDYGYKYLMSDYATSFEKERKYEAEGRQQVKKTVKALISIIKEERESWVKEISAELKEKAVGEPAKYILERVRVKLVKASKL